MCRGSGVHCQLYFAAEEPTSFWKRGSLPATAGKLCLLDGVLGERPAMVATAAKAARRLATADVRARGTVCRDHSH
jgi:hypothetical protein